MTREEKIGKIKPEYRWFWACSWHGGATVLSAQWRDTKDSLLMGKKPTPDAFPVRVRLTPVWPTKRSGHHRKAKP